MAGGLAWGDICLVDFGPPYRSRPALILTRTSAIPHLNTVTVAPLTTTVRDIPSEIMIGPECGLKALSAASFDNLLTVRKSRVGQHVGTLSPDRRGEVRDALLFALGLNLA